MISENLDIHLDLFVSIYILEALQVDTDHEYRQIAQAAEYN